VATCTTSGGSGTSWVFQAKGTYCSPGPNCPTSVTEGGTCSAAIYCDYANRRCACEAPLGGPVTGTMALSWACQDATPPSCPLPRPRLGAACTAAGVLCNYGACTIPGGVDETCNNGIWVLANVKCAVPF
jgi:hypothetical protein